MNGIEIEKGVTKVNAPLQKSVLLCIREDDQDKYLASVKPETPETIYFGVNMEKMNYRLSHSKKTLKVYQNKSVEEIYEEQCGEIITHETVHLTFYKLSMRWESILFDYIDKQHEITGGQ